MKNKQWNNIGAVPKSNGKIVEIEAKSIPLTHIYTAQYVSSECSTRDITLILFDKSKLLYISRKNVFLF
jgi:hypothetical protein